VLDIVERRHRLDDVCVGIDAPHATPKLVVLWRET
jgi:hypothetical protein